MTIDELGMLILCLSIVNLLYTWLFWYLYFKDKNNEQKKINFNTCK